jgi:cyanophycin synthetase
VYIDGELIEAGDFSGPGGAARVLRHPGVELAVTETARGGILRRGVGVAPTTSQW